MECSVYSTVKNIGVSERRVKDIVFFVLEKLKKENAAVSLHFIGEKKIRQLNREYRGKDYVTDVLSFAMHTDGEKMPKLPKEEAVDWGDIFICVPKIKKQAKEHGITYKEESTRMIVHSVLHLLGYDHMKDKDAKKMIPLQEKIITEVMT
jgi:probable rRNA maturation factor